MDLVTELVVLAVSLAGTVFLARLEHANRLPRLVANDGTLSALVGALTVGICFGLIGLVFKVETITGSPLIFPDVATRGLPKTSSSSTCNGE